MRARSLPLPFGSPPMSDIGLLDHVEAGNDSVMVPDRRWLTGDSPKAAALSEVWSGHKHLAVTTGRGHASAKKLSS